MTQVTPGRDRTAGRSFAALSIAALAAITIALAGCTPTVEPVETAEPLEPRNLTLQLGSLLPQTGSFDRYGPGTLAAVELAVQDINDADLGIQIVHESRDAGDTSSDTAATSTQELLDLGSTVIIGPVSDGVAKKVIGTITSAGVLQLSPGNRSSDFTSFPDDDLYWRTSSSCALSGTAIAKQIFEDGAKTLGVIAQEDYCAPALQQAVVTQFERSGGSVSIVETYEPTAGSLTEINAAVVEAAPDAVVLLTQEKAGLSVPDLVAAGYTGEELYFVGLGLGDRSGDFGSSIFGAKTTRAGIDVDDIEDFTERLLEINPSITDFGLTAETYDAVVLAALGALAANDTDGAAIAEHLREISGGTGKGEVATDFATAAKLILEGKVVDYEGVSGSITFDDKGDPQGAIIGIFQYEDDHTWSRVN